MAARIAETLGHLEDAALDQLAATGVPWPTSVARPDTDEHEHQRCLRFKLAATPPADGDRPTDLVRSLGFSRAAVGMVADGLVTVGLAERRGDRLFPSQATMALDALWPLG